MLTIVSAGNGSGNQFARGDLYAKRAAARNGGAYAVNFSTGHARGVLKAGNHMGNLRRDAEAQRRGEANAGEMIGVKTK